MNPTNQTAIVTGGGSGLGATIPQDIVRRMGSDAEGKRRCVGHRDVETDPSCGNRVILFLVTIPNTFADISELAP